jgi:murein DD-endopeptidase MepM/ murein hydrolase activator NlpD
MRFAPVANSRESYQNDWYLAQGFGAVTTYGRHEGIDLNLKTGGDSDLGQPLYAVANGQVVYYHRNSHPTTGFGRHLVIRIDGPWGTRWCHYCHMEDADFLGSSQTVTEGQMVGRLGKSGNSPSAHLHFAILKVDPATSGIDNIANNETELNQVWEDPISFINTWSAAAPAPQPVITDQTRIPQIDNLEVQQIRSLLNDLRNQNAAKDQKLTAVRAIVV